MERVGEGEVGAKDVENGLSGLDEIQEELFQGGQGRRLLGRQLTTRRSNSSLSGSLAEFQFQE